MESFELLYLNLNSDCLRYSQSTWEVQVKWENWTRERQLLNISLGNFSINLWWHTVNIIARFVCHSIYKSPFLPAHGSDYISFSSCYSLLAFLKLFNPRKLLRWHYAPTRGACEMKHHEVIFLSENKSYVNSFVQKIYFKI